MLFFGCIKGFKETGAVVLFVALLVHAGIALFIGMITFRTMMMVANLAFLPARFAERFDPSRTHGHQH